MVTGTPTAKANRSLLELARRLKTYDGFTQCLEALQRGESVTIDGVWGSVRALLTSALAGDAPSTLLVVCTDQDQLDDLYDDTLTFFGDAVDRLVPSQTSEHDRERIDENDGHRLQLVKQLAAVRGPKVLLTSVAGLLQPVPSLAQLQAHTRTISVGDTLDPLQLQHWLVERGFHSTSAVELPGEFSVRGGILDLFAADWQHPVRVELFDDEVESIRQFDLQSQTSVAPLDQIEITALPSQGGEQKLAVDLLPADSWIMLLEPDLLVQQAQQQTQRSEHPEELFGWDEVQRAISNRPTVLAHAIAPGALKTSCKLKVESVQRFSGELAEVRSELDRIGDGHEVFVVAQVEGEIERLQEILQSSRIAGQGGLRYAVGTVHEGFSLVPDKIIVVSGDELFRRGELKRTPRRHMGRAIDSFVDLREGDLIVHLAHGIGRFRGLRLLTKEGHTQEHLELEFHGGTKIYVPASKIDLVQKYVGGSRTRPRLAQIGGKAWVRQKQAAEEAVSDMAAEMIELQAARASRPGIRMATDTQWQREMENAFPYRETPDQSESIKMIKADMESGRPMDRLLCGDVGFGKTEIAMRAAFKAVENGYQVAALVPTTVLAEQHFRTFSQRMSEFPLDIAKLSRFCTTSQQRETLQRLKQGNIDIVIGTHRLASRDVNFANLGLLIIDEEQRFGVEVKQRLRSMRATVDVLTMSATPIPRTLHMSLVGIRDISNLETPPDDRLAVETHLTRFDPELIRHAVLRELNRNGQIYFVHNRVEDIQQVKQQLLSIVPEATIGVGHGQMAEGELEKVMTGFIHKQYDVLLATTIIESGLDIPNANTIFIDQADRYGLADLHQLRGRVGRYKHRAHCYLLIDPHKHINPTAAKRLRAIEEFSEMGAGFSIAMRDLEIRGAGNLLGTEQSGHIAAVGYELYCQLLETAIRALKKMPTKITIDVDIELPGEAHLPVDYINDKRHRIDLYRRLTRLDRYDQLDQFRAELVDRFGKLPRPAKRMLALTELKLDAAIWQIQAIYCEDRYLVFRYSDRNRIQQLNAANKRRLRIVDDESAYVTLKPEAREHPDQLIRLAKSILQAKP